MRRKFLYADLCLLAVLTFGTTPAWTAEKVPSDRLLSPDVHVYVSIPSVADLKAKWQKSLLGQLRKEKALAAFWRDVEAQLDKLSDEVKTQLGVTLSDLLAIPDGEVAVAVVQPPEAKLGVVALLDFGDSRQTVDKLLEKAEKALADQGAERKVEEAEGTRMIVYKLGGGGDAGADDPAERKFAYFVKGSHLVVGNDVPVLKSVVARWDGQHEKTFAGNQTYRTIIDHCRGEGAKPVLTWYVNPVGLATAAVTSFGQGNLQAQLMLAILPTLGLTKLKAIGGTFDMAAGDYDSISRTLAYVDLPTSGILKALQFPATEQSPPKWVASSASTYVGFNWDVAGAYAAVEALVDVFKGPGTFNKLIEGMAEDPTGPKLHPKKDVIDQLTGRIHLVFDQPKNDDPQGERFLVALAVKDAAKMTDVLASVAKTPGFPGKPREFQGQTFYEMPTGGALGEDAAATGGVAVINGHLMVANDVALLEQIVRPDKNRQPLAESPEYRRLAAHYPKKVSVLSFQKQKRRLKSYYGLLRSGTAGVEVTGIDFTKLPPFETIQKYLPATGGYVLPDQQGALYVSFSLRGTKD